MPNEIAAAVVVVVVGLVECLVVEARLVVGKPGSPVQASFDPVELDWASFDLAEPFAVGFVIEVVAVQ